MDFNSSSVFLILFCSGYSGPKGISVPSENNETLIIGINLNDLKLFLILKVDLTNILIR